MQIDGVKRHLCKHASFKLTVTCLAEVVLLSFILLAQTLSVSSLPQSETVIT